mgnify:CR=1 FL=1|jgi:septal ring factor EnvC (AmiA/AmiB activator)
MKTDLEHTSEALQNARDELAKLRHQLADAESQLANMRDRNAAGRDLADAVKRLVAEEIDSRFSGDTFEDRVRPVVEDIARDMMENATVEIDGAYLRV